MPVWREKNASPLSFCLSESARPFSTHSLRSLMESRPSIWGEDLKYWTARSSLFPVPAPAPCARRLWAL